MSELVVTLRKLHPGQQRVRDSQARFRVAMCGAQSGKTTFGVDETAEYLLAGKRVGWFAPSYKFLDEPRNEIHARLRDLIDQRNKTERRTTFKTGGLLDLWTCDDPDAGRGRAYHLVVFDEAGITPNLEIVWEQAVRPRLTTYNGRALFLGTPKGRTHYFSKLFLMADKGDNPEWEAFRFATAINPAQRPQEIADAKASLPPGVFAQEFEGIPADDGANPFGLDAIADCTVKKAEELAEMAAAEPFVFGWDFARSQDWTVGIALDAIYRVVRCHRWQAVPWGEQKARIQNFNRHVSAWGDATRSRVDDVIVEDLGRMGVPMIPVQSSAPMKQALMQRLQVCIQQRKLRIPDGPIARELETFQFRYTRYGVEYTAPPGMHDDCVMALALAVYGRDQFGELPEQQKPVAFDPDLHPGFTQSRGDEHPRRNKPWEQGWQPNVPDRHWVPSKELTPL